MDPSDSECEIEIDQTQSSSNFAEIGDLWVISYEHRGALPTKRQRLHREVKRVTRHICQKLDEREEGNTLRWERIPLDRKQQHWIQLEEANRKREIASSYTARSPSQ